MFKAMILVLLALSAIPTEARPYRPHIYYGGGSYLRERPACGFGTVIGVDHPKSGEWGCQSGEAPIYRRTPQQEWADAYAAQAQDSWNRKSAEYDKMADAQDYADQVANAPASGAALREQIRPIDLTQSMPVVKWSPQ